MFLDTSEESMSKEGERFMGRVESKEAELLMDTIDSIARELEVL